MNVAIQHLGKKKRAGLIVRKLENGEDGRTTDKKVQKRYQRMLGNLLADQ